MNPFLQHLLKQSSDEDLAIARKTSVNLRLSWKSTKRGCFFLSFSALKVWRLPTFFRCLLQFPHFLFLYSKLLYQSLCGTFAVAHGKDYGCTSADDVAASIESGDIGLHVVVDHAGVLASEFQSFNRGRNDGVGTHAYSDND